jgi:hypothetical protein
MADGRGGTGFLECMIWYSRAKAGFVIWPNVLLPHVIEQLQTFFVMSNLTGSIRPVNL